MQRPSPGVQQAHLDTRTTARDPRLKNRMPSTSVVDQAIDSERGGYHNHRDSLGLGDVTPHTNTPQSAISRLDGAHSVLSEAPDLQIAFLRHTRNAQNADFLGRRLKFLRRERENAQTEYGQFKKTKEKFPVLAEQALQRKNKVESEYQIVKQEEANARAAEEASVAILPKLFLEAVKEKDEAVKEKDVQFTILTEQVAAMQRDLQEMRSQQTKAAARPPPVSEDLKTRIETLETFRSLYLSVQYPAFMTFDTNFKNSEQRVENLDTKYSKANEVTEREIEKLRSEQRSTSKGATEAIDVLKSEVESLRRRVESLEQIIPSIETQLRDSQSLPTAEKEQYQQILDASKAQQQTFDGTERLRRTIHLEVETAKNEVSTMKADLGSLGSQVSILRADHSKLTQEFGNIQPFGTSQGPGSAAVEIEISALKKVDQDQLEKVAALETAVQDISDKVGSLKTQFMDFITPGHTIDAAGISQRLQTIEGQLVENGVRHDHVELKNRETSQSLTKGLADQEIAWKKLQNDLTTGFAHQEAGRNKLEGEFNLCTEKWTRTENRQEKALSDAVTKMQDEQTILRVGLSQRPAPGLSYEERRQIQDATSAALVVRNLETQVTGLQKGLEKQSHISLGLNQRFNNLSTETLAKQILTVGNKALPKFENRLQKIEGEVEVLRLQLETPALAGAGKQITSIEESLKQLETSCRGQYDILAKNFEDGRDVVVTRIDGIEASDAAYRGSTANQFQAHETKFDSINSQLDNFNVQIEAIKSQESSRTGHKQPSLGSRSTVTSSDGTQAALKRPKQPGSHSVTPQTRSSLSRSSNSGGGRASRTLHDSEDEDDEDAEDLLAKFAQPITNLRQSPRRAQPKHGKRKRSQSRENSNDSDFTAKGRASKTR